jgi:hypothetical protein
MRQKGQYDDGDNGQYGYAQYIDTERDSWVDIKSLDADGAAGGLLNPQA